MQHKAIELKDRTKRFALRIIKLIRALPPCPEAKVIGFQLLRSGTSVGANYRAVCRSRSRAEFLSKLSIVIEEADETAFWLDLLSDQDSSSGALTGSHFRSESVSRNFCGISANGKERS